MIRIPGPTAQMIFDGKECDFMLGECGAVGNLLLDKGYQPYMDGSVVCEHLDRAAQARAADHASEARPSTTEALVST